MHLAVKKRLLDLKHPETITVILSAQVTLLCLPAIQFPAETLT